MIPHLRKAYNEQFTQEKFDRMVTDIESVYDQSVVFRVSETPVFVPADLTRKLVSACESIVDVIVQPNFKDLTEKSIPDNQRLPNEPDFSHFIVMDFGIMQDKEGVLQPRLIEMQGFPSLFCWQDMLATHYKKHFDIPANLNNFFNGFDHDKYIGLLSKIVLDDCKPEEVVLLEVKPKEQKTRIDFYATQGMLGIEILDLNDLKADGKTLWYLKDGKRQDIKRIYNRIIFDDLFAQDDLGDAVDLTKSYDVQWIPHPNWFYRISKYTLPFIDNEYVPKTRFLSEFRPDNADLDKYVLKPLFSFAGQGVVIDVRPEDLDAVKDPENWIVQEKVDYGPVIETPNVPAKCEIRMIYFWEPGASRPTLVHNLCRMSKGKMVGVRYNDEFDWVGGTVCFFEH
ncbi:MAG: hypothetical protein ABIV51_12140 [Saprospiraceae bacterium]